MSLLFQDFYAGNFPATSTRRNVTTSVLNIFVVQYKLIIPALNLGIDYMNRNRWLAIYLLPWQFSTKDSNHACDRGYEIKYIHQVHWSVDHYHAMISWQMVHCNLSLKPLYCEVRMHRSWKQCAHNILEQTVFASTKHQLLCLHDSLCMLCVFLIMQYI